MSKAPKLRPGCRHVGANKLGIECVFCESAERISGLQRDLAARGSAYSANKAAHEIKPIHRHKQMTTRGRSFG